MREIKFRGKRIDTGGWIYGDLVRFSEESASIVRNYGTMDISIYDVDPKTVGQYTGLKDKNGKEIWEDNIVKISKQHVISGIPITFVDHVCYIQGSFYVTIAGKLSLLNLKSNELEVIGTIHDNPELLEVTTT